MERGNDVLAYSYEDAAKLIGVSKQTVIRLAKDGTLPVKRLGRRVLIPRESLERLVS
jgi:excisionase family DNA binding protein